jgi:hypothetical protein
LGNVPPKSRDTAPARENTPDLKILFSELVSLETELRDAVETRLLAEHDLTLPKFEFMRVISRVSACRGAWHRGRHDRFEHDPAPAETETAMYRDAAATLAGLGVPVTQIDTGLLTPQQVAGQIADTLASRCASLSDHG